MIKKNTLHRRMAIAAFMLSLTGTSALTMERNDWTTICSQNRPLTLQQIESLQKRLSETVKQVTEAYALHPHQNMTLIVGPTGGGKSTLATFLAGSSLKAKLHIDALVLDGSILNNPHITIGHEATSGTTRPGFYWDELRNTVVWDCPGFGDVSGPVSKIVNAVALSSLLKTSKKIRVLVVFDENKISSRYGEIIDLFNHLTDIFPDTDQVKQMVSLVITKKSSTSKPLEHLKRCAQATNDLSQKGRDLLLYLYENSSSRIAYLPKPTVEGPYTGPTDLWATIGKTGYVERPEANLAIPDGAREHLRRLSNELNQNIIKTLLNSRSFLVTAFKQRITELENNDAALKQYMEGRINEMSALVDILPDSEIDHIRAFARIPGLPEETQASLISLMDQMRTLKGIAGNVDGIKFDTPEWFNALKDTILPWMTDIKNAEITRLEKEAAQALVTQKEKALFDALALVAQREQALNQARNDLKASQGLVAQTEQARLDALALVAQKKEALRQAEQALNQTRMELGVSQASVAQKKQALVNAQALAVERERVLQQRTEELTQVRMELSVSQASVTQKEQALVDAQALAVEREQVLQQRTEELTQVRRELTGKAAQYNASVEEMERFRAAHLADIQRLEQGHGAAIQRLRDDLRTTHGEEIQRLRAAHQGELQRFEQGHGAAIQRLRDDLQTTHGEEIQRLRLAHQGELQRLQQGHGAAIQRLRDDLQTTHGEEIQRLRADHREAIQRKDASIQRQEGQLRERDALIQGQRGQIQQKDVLIQEKDALIQGKDYQIQGQKGQIQQKDQTIQWQGNEISRLTQEVQSAQTLADGLTNKINGEHGKKQQLEADLSKVLAERDAQTHRANAAEARGNDLQNQVNGLTGELYGLRGQIDGLKGQVGQLELSLKATRIKGGKTKVDLVEYWKRKGWHAYTWTSNKNGYPTIEEIAAAWGVTVDELLT